MKFPARIILLIATLVFFFVIALPLNYALSSVIGVENATAVLAAIYIILTGITFGLIFYKDFY
ncbi:hypothetical protein [Sulfurisphaera tokodaii]|uniref:Uncharacterized protein n=2 Tax=Sulfurisphaera tokodaii TaxID=111955 RepID=Q976Q7_SULTO|nr:hypothetical protein [Sulfurisphaera tokodaii]BAB65089.1 hypothetical protein STK_01334 [Sulfurisphaera tokodaii str. 7]HII74114.1 hypothetical protein [Sulfurisphaera tokodaii]